MVLPLGEMMVARPGTVLLLFTVESRAVEGFYSVYLIGAAYERVGLRTKLAVF